MDRIKRMLSVLKLSGKAAERYSPLFSKGVRRFSLVGDLEGEL